MKIRSLLLGSVAAAGLTTGAFAADLGVLTSVDICDSLGLSGLTISSDTNCLQITGEVTYEFNWGDYADDSEVDADNPYIDDEVGFDDDDGINDWQSRVDAWLQFVATANSDFGPAKAVLKLLYVSDELNENSTASIGGSDTGGGVNVDEAYVSIGDSTMIMAGKKGSIFEDGEDEPLNFLGLFNSEMVDVGVGNSLFDDPNDGDGRFNDGDLVNTGGHVIQIVSDLGNGISIGAGLEDLDGFGTFVGVVQYAGDGLAAHASVKVGDILGDKEDGDAWAVHAGFAGTFENFKVVVAGAFDSQEYYNVLASASATFDIFTIAGSVEAAGDTVFGDMWGAGASLSATVTDTVTLNIGGRWFEETDGDNVWEVAASVTAAVTETISLTGTVGYAAEDGPVAADLFYGSAEVSWTPGAESGFTSSLKGQANSDGGYKATFKAAKTFE